MRSLFSRRRRGVVFLGVLAATGSLLAAPGRAGPEPKAPPRTLELTGRIAPAEQADLYARVPGYVRKVNADIGDRVKAGDVLVELSVPELTAGLDEKKAEVKRAEAEVENARRAVQIAEAAPRTAVTHAKLAEAAVKRAAASSTAKKKHLERLSDLRKSGNIDQGIIDDAQRDADVAMAAVAEAQARLQEARAAQPEAEARHAMAQVAVKAAEAGLQVAQAAARRAAVMLQYSRVPAPFDGVVVKRAVNVGDLAGPVGDRRGELLFTVARIDRVRVVVDVPERDVSRVRKGGRATVRVEVYPKRSFTGAVARLAPALDPNKGSLRVEIDVPNPNSELLPGMFARVSLDAPPQAPQPAGDK